MACDIIVAAEHAFLGWWYTKRALATDMGGCWYLTQVVGPYRAKEIIATARNVYAPELKELGIASRVASYDNLDDVVDELCGEIIENAPVAIAADKELVDKSVAMPRWPWFDQSTEMILGVIDTDDCTENRLTGLRGEKPVWKGR
jgi:enoyl-CoA hydratase/carnithine racemase